MVLRSLHIEKVAATEVCDFCGGPARLKATNRKFFVLVTCANCWSQLKEAVDASFAEDEAGTGKRVS